MNGTLGLYRGEDLTLADPNLIKRTSKGATGQVIHVEYVSLTRRPTSQYT